MWTEEELLPSAMPDGAPPLRGDIAGAGPHRLGSENGAGRRAAQGSAGLPGEAAPAPEPGCVLRALQESPGSSQQLSEVALLPRQHHR